MANSKKAAQAALRELPTLLSRIPHYDEQKQALEHLKHLDHFIGELRRERSQLKDRTEGAEQAAQPLREKLTKAEQELQEALLQLQQTQSKLKATQGTLKIRESQCLELAQQADPEHRLEHLQLTVGCPAPAVIARRQQLMQEIVEDWVPHLARMLPEVGNSPNPSLTLCQCMMGRGHAADDYTMAGMLIKYFGSHGVTVMVHPHDRHEDYDSDYDSDFDDEEDWF